MVAMHHGALSLLANGDAGDASACRKGSPRPPRSLHVPHTARFADSCSHGSIQTRLVGPSSTRSVGPAIGLRIVSISCTNMSPIVRVLALRALAATSERVMPAARNFWYDADRCSAPTNSHQLSLSYSPSRRCVARGEDLPEARAEERQIVGREVGDGPERQQNVAQQRAGIAGRARKDRRHDECRLAVLREADACRRHQMIRHLAPVKRRDAPHGVDHVLVEAGEEAKTMLAGQVVLDGCRAGVGELVSAGAGAIVDHGNAARLAAGNIAALENHDLEAALDQLVRGTHAGDATAQHDDPSRHVLLSYRRAARLPAAGPLFGVTPQRLRPAIQA